MKTILVTAGGTREYIDDVRVVTNISSGALGAKIVEELYQRGAKVHYVHARYGVMPTVQEGISETARLTTWPIVTVNDLHDTMRTVLSAFKVDAVIHSAAVSDFTFKRDGAIKLSSSSPEDFIEYMRKTITPAPKIIKKVKEWSPDTFLVGFKFTVGETQEGILRIARKQMDTCGSDLVVANDKEMMSRANSHQGFVVSKDTWTFHTKKDDIARGLMKWLEDRV